MSELISRTEAAALVGVSSDTLARWSVKEGSDFPKPVAWVSHRRFYSKGEILAWLSSRTSRKPPSRPRAIEEARP